jgi:hypothetical protein
MSEKFNILDFDSNFFGFKIAKVVDTNLNTSELTKLILNLKDEGVQLAYFSSNSKLDLSVSNNLLKHLCNLK